LGSNPENVLKVKLTAIKITNTLVFHRIEIIEITSVLPRILKL
jgi:hypothetical protein